MAATKEKGGLAKVDPKRRKEIARQGGRAGHKYGNSHEFTKAEARAAGRKGGLEKARRARERKEKAGKK